MEVAFVCKQFLYENDMQIVAIYNQQKMFLRLLMSLIEPSHIESGDIKSSGAHVATSNTAV